MFAPTRYLEWARRFYGRVPFDLASSGMTNVALAELGVDWERVDDPTGWSRFRSAIARYNGVADDESIAALGTAHALWLAYAALTSPGDEILVEQPAYEPLVGIAGGMGLRVRRFERAASEKFAIDPDRVARAMTEATRVVVVTNLHNPSGARADDAALAAIARRLEGRGGHLLVDEVYAPFDALTDESGVFLGSARRLAPNVVTTSSLTKCYGLGNHRFGWVLGPRDVIERAEHAITASCGMLPLAHANIGADAFARVPWLAERARRLLGGKRRRVEAWIARRPELAWSAPACGLFGFATAKRDGDLTPIIERGVAEHGVLVAAGAFFEMPNGFRLSWSIAEEKLDEALERLGRVLDSK